jgi:hypothetical protein
MTNDMSKVNTGRMRSSAQARAVGRAFFFLYRPFVRIIGAPRDRLVGLQRPAFGLWFGTEMPLTALLRRKILEAFASYNVHMIAMKAEMLLFLLFVQIAFVAFVQGLRSSLFGYSSRQAFYVMFGAILAAFLLYFPAFGY